MMALTRRTRFVGQSFAVLHINIIFAYCVINVHFVTTISIEEEAPSKNAIVDQIEMLHLA